MTTIGFKFYWGRVMTSVENIKPGIPLALLFLFFTLPAFAEPVGRILVVSGSAHAQAMAGGQRVLAQDAIVERGDTLTTGADGNIQVRFVDGALLMVRANSRIRIDDYRAEGNTLYSVMSLLSGGIRTLTGRIGKTRRDAYLMNTATASIGVRGTDYELRLCAGDCPAGSPDGLYLGVAEGEIEARNEAGTFGLKAREYGFIRSKNAALEKLTCPPEALTGVPCEHDAAVIGIDPGTGANESAAGYRAGEQREPDGLRSQFLRGVPCGSNRNAPPCP